MTSLEEFQQLHGEAFAHILANPAFNAGMIHLSIEMTNAIKRLTDAEIAVNSVVILSDFRGRLLHQASLFSLAVPPEPSGKGDPVEEYVNAEDEFFKEHQRSNPAPAFGNP